MYQTLAHDEAALHRTNQSSELWRRINAVSQYYSTHGLQSMKSDMIGIHKQEFEVPVSQKYLQKKANDSIVVTKARADEVKPFLQRKGRRQDNTFTHWVK